ncbi:MAG: pyruvate dehydrogenase complex dihydrolipoamide acetyltransferase [Bacteroidia bacterium]|nr:pyruvate dehydrogenase complex dihydrolipoamide acetyltransferase [Bacteroidia bacterium]
MAEIVRMPKLSDTMTEGTVARWIKKVGDKVKSGEILAEIDSDKATMEFESFYDGVLLHIGVEEKKGAPVDAILAIIGKEGEDISDILKAENKTVPPREEHKKVQKKEEPVSVPPVSATPSTSTPVPTHSPTRLKASPLAKKLAKEKGLILNKLKGTGDGGRITRRDIELFHHQGGSLRTVTGTESYTEESVSQMRKTIARRLAESKFSSPHFYLTMEISMDNTVEARELINDAAGVKVSYNDFVVKAAAAALRRHPKVNASWKGDVIRYYNHIHIGVAVAVDEGLLVPVIRFADAKPLTQIGAEVKEFSKRAKDKKLEPKDWEGNTFTVSNLGMYGIDEFTAIINPPDACILAVGGISQRPVVKNGQIVPGYVMKVTLSCDHRVVDGATGAAFLQTFRDLLENPVLLLGMNEI